MRKILIASLAFLSLLSVAPVSAAPTQRTLIKSPDFSTIYWYAADGKRYVFPTEATYKTWFADFSSIRTVTSAELAAIRIGGNVTYRPGAKLIKIMTVPKVYAISRGGVLRPLASEAVAASLYGSNWNQQIDDLPEAFFFNYQVGSEISTASDYNRSAELASAPDIDMDKGLATTPAPAPTPPPTTAGAPHVGTCQIFPSDNPWNTDISGYAVSANSAAYIASIGSTKGLHPDFGQDPTYGIPYDVVSASQAKVPINFTAYGDESDPGPYPIPPNAKVESGGDRHVLVVDQDNCLLYELFGAVKTTNGWNADSGAKFDLKSNALRPEGWTSTDAAGLPVFAGLVRYDEVTAGAINHAIRFTASPTQNAYIHPATHEAGSNNATYPPMGLRVRLNKDYDISGLTGQARVVAEAMKKYGMILADNGGDWFFQGEKGAAWNDSNLSQLTKIPGSAFEAIETGALIK